MTMKLLVFNWRDINHPKAGGAEVHLQEIFKRIAKNHDVHLVSSKFKGCPNSEIIDGIKVNRIGNEYLFNFSACYYYLKKLRNKKFDIIIDDYNKVPFFTPLYIKKIPLCVIIHGTFGKGEMLFKSLSFPIAFYAFFLERLIPFIYKNKQFLTATNGLSLKEKLLELGIDEKKIKLMSSGVDNNLFPKTSENDNPLILYFGRIARYKNIDHLIKSFFIVKDNIPSAELVIAGRGDYTEIEKLVNKLNLSCSVKLLGEVSNEKKIKLLQNAWVLAIPSMNEGWGFVVTEANACGTPAVAYDVPGLNDSIRNEETGLLINFGNINQLSQALIRILSDDKYRKKLGENAIDFAKKFNWDNSANEMIMELEKMIQKEK